MQPMSWIQWRGLMVDEAKTMGIKESVQTKSRFIEKRLNCQGNPHHPANFAPHLDVMREYYS